MKFKISLLSCLLFSSISFCQEHTIDTLKLIETDSLFQHATRLFNVERKFKESKQLFHKVDSLYQAFDMPERIITTKRRLYLCSFALFEPFEKQIKPLNEALAFVQKCDSKSIEVATLYKSLSLIYNRFKDNDAARYYGLKALHIFNDEKNANTLEYLDDKIGNLQNLGSIERKISNFKQAEDYFNQSLEIGKRFNKNLSTSLGSLFYVYISSNQVSKIETFIENEHKSGFLSNAKLFDIIDYYGDKIYYYSNSNQFDLALTAADDLEKIISKSTFKRHFSRLFFNRRKATIYYKMKAYDKAIAIGELSLKSKDFELAKNDDRAIIFTLLAKCYLAIGEIEKAVTNIEKSLSNNYTKRPNDFYEKVKSSNLIAYSTDILLRLQIRSEICKAQYAKTQEEKYFNATLDAYQTLHEAMKLLGQKSHEDQFLEHAFFKKTYGTLLDLYHTKWKQNTQDNTVFYNALTVSDESKVIAVLNEIKTIKQSKLFGSVSRELLATEKAILFASDSINRLYKFANDDVNLKRAKDSIENDFENLKASLRKEHLQYYQLKYGSQKLIETIIKQKYNEYNRLQFFLSDDAIFVFNDNGSKKYFDKIPLDQTLKQNIDLLLSQLRDNKNTNFRELGYSIYKKLFQKYIDPTKKTVLVLDGKLHLLPVEALWTSKNDTGNYLLKETSILRLNSFKQDVVLPNNKSASMSLFAPYASKSNQDNTQILASLSEVEQINTLFDGDVFIDEKASKNEFLKQVLKHPIIHLATHSSIDEKNPLKSKIYFNDSSQVAPYKRILNIEELYNMKLNSSLVTLSSCDTGIGKEVKGKGVLSLSNAFLFAGVSSTVMSLWKVPDKETSKIIVAFYNNLSLGQEKDEALKNAKLAYLETIEDDLLKHPYYWAGFVVSGDASPIVSKNSPAIWIALGTVFFCLFGFVWMTKQQKQVA